MQMKKTVVRLHGTKSCVNLAPDGGEWSASGPVCLTHEERHSVLTLNLPTTTIVALPFNVIKWQLKFNPVA